MSRDVLVPIYQPPQPVGHLFCLHHAGGAAYAYREWGPHFRSDVALTATVLPGRGRRFKEEMHGTLEAAADEITDAITRTWTPGRNILFGHSMGGLMAFEVCRRLEDRGLQPDRLVISGVGPGRRPWKERRHLWSDDRLRKLLVEMGGTPPEVLAHQDLMAMFIPILRADLRLIEAYEPERDHLVSAPITVMAGDDDRDLSLEELLAWEERSESAEFESKIFSGGHFYLAENREEVVGWLRTHLSSVGALPDRNSQE